ncbi:MAG: hypothetical protein L3J89_12690 [Gammaproteobacteria bacterium]|nr:hypothetical protein [Gammaproteobacteria bacterium]
MRIHFSTVTSLALSMGLLLSLPAFSSIEDETQSAVNNFPIAEQLATYGLDKKRNQYLEKRGWSLGYNQKPNGDNFYIGWGQADIIASAKDIAFADSRVIAFESALLTAKGEFTRSNSLKIATESMQTFFVDESDTALDSAAFPNALQQFGEKILTWGNATLDRQLTEMGIDPSQFSLKKKRELARESFQKTTIASAISSVSGLRPLVTFEDNNSVGVIVVYSKKLKQQANDIARGKLVPSTTAISGAQKISEQLSSKLAADKDYIFQHGIRIMKDEFGNTALVSFGQSGVKATASTSKLQLKLSLRAAKIMARSLAESQLAEFVNATVSLRDKTSLIGSSAVTEISEGDLTSINETSNIGKVIDQYIKQNANVKLSGISALKTWSANHPESGHLIVGEVLTWSPYLSELTQSINRKPSASLKKRAINNNMRESIDLESDASF